MIDSLQYQNAVNIERLEEHVKKEQYWYEENKRNKEEVERMKRLIKEKENEWIKNEKEYEEELRVNERMVNEELSETETDLCRDIEEHEEDDDDSTYSYDWDDYYSIREEFETAMGAIEMQLNKM